MTGATIEHEARSAGVNLLMSKPMFKSSLVSAFSRVLGERRKRRRRINRKFMISQGAGFFWWRTTPLIPRWPRSCWRAGVLPWILRKTGCGPSRMFSKSEAGFLRRDPHGYQDAADGRADGYQNIRHLTNRDAGTVPIIAMTANAFDDDIEKSKVCRDERPPGHLPLSRNGCFQVLYHFILGQ